MKATDFMRLSILVVILLKIELTVGCLRNSDCDYLRYCCSYIYCCSYSQYFLTIFSTTTPRTLTFIPPFSLNTIKTSLPAIETDTSNFSSSVGVILGIVVGGTVLLVGGIGACVYCCFRSNRTQPGFMVGTTAMRQPVQYSFTHPYPGQAYPGQAGQAYPGQASHAYPEQVGQPYPGQAGQAYPGQAGQAYPGQVGQPCTEQTSQAYPGKAGQAYTGQAGQAYPVQANAPGPSNAVTIGQSTSPPPYPAKSDEPPPY